MILFVVILILSVSCEYVYVPGGFLANSKCIRNLNSDDAHIIRKKDHFLVKNGGKYEKDSICSDIMTGGENSWQSWTTLDYTKQADQIDLFTSNMVVPKAPESRSGQILYIFPALQNVDWIPTNPGPMPHPFDIIQPVLQYNYGGGDEWILANWYVGDDHVYTSKYIYGLKEGDVIFGNISRTGDATYNIFASVNGKSTNLGVTSNHLRKQSWGYTTVEKYGGSTCSAFPKSDLEFNDMHLYVDQKEISFEWVSHILNPCVTKIDIEGQEKVIFSFNNEE